MTRREAREQAFMVLFEKIFDEESTISEIVEIAKENEQVRSAVYSLGVEKEIEPFMNMAFVSLTVIPELKMSTTGLVLVEKQQKVDLYIN